MNQVHEAEYTGTSKLMSALILLMNKEFGWPIRTNHGPLGSVYVEYKAKGATITLYGALISPNKDELEIHLRIHEFTADMSELIASITDQIETLSADPNVADNRYIVFEESPHGAVS